MQMGLSQPAVSRGLARLRDAYDDPLFIRQPRGVLATPLAEHLAAPLAQALAIVHGTVERPIFNPATDTRHFHVSMTDIGERFFLPLGMNSAAYGMSGLIGAKDWARPHNAEQVRPLKESYWRVPAAAGVESNIVDFARWLQATMGERPDILPISVLSLAQAPRVETERLYGGELKQANSDATYGLGWRSFNYGGSRLVGHSGAVDGYRATMIFDPETRTGVVAMWNSNWGRPFRIPFAVSNSYHKQVDSRWLDLSDVPIT